MADASVQLARGVSRCSCSAWPGIARRSRRRSPSCADSETAKAAGLAGAMIANNIIALGSTVVFAGC